MSELTQILVESYKTREKTKNAEIIVLASATFFILLLGFLTVKITNGQFFSTPIAGLIIFGIGGLSLLGALGTLVFAGAVPLKHKLNEQKKEQLTRKDKQINELRKDNENLTNELEHERIHSDNQHRIIKWLSGLNGSFYKDDVDNDE